MNSLKELESNIPTNFTNKNFATITYEENAIEINVITWGKSKDVPLFINELKHKYTKESLLRGFAYNILIEFRDKIN